MTAVRVYIAGMGIITSLGNGIAKTREAIINSLTGIRPLTLFPTTSHQPLPVGQVSDLTENGACASGVSVPIVNWTISSLEIGSAS